MDRPLARPAVLASVAARPAVPASVAARPAVLASVAVLLAGCGSSTHLHASHHARVPQSANPTASGNGSLTPGPTGIPAGSQAVSVIKAWSTALRHGNLRAAAGFFQLPSEMINGTSSPGVASVVVIHSRAQAAAANASLPCGARFISADQRGPYVNALFRLTGRAGPGGTACNPGAGQTARTNFLIRKGRIVQWIRAPDDPGDNQGSAGGGPAV